MGCILGRKASANVRLPSSSIFWNSFIPPSQAGAFCATTKECVDIVNALGQASAEVSTTCSLCVYVRARMRARMRACVRACMCTHDADVIPVHTKCHSHRSKCGYCIAACHSGTNTCRLQ